MDSKGKSALDHYGELLKKVDAFCQTVKEAVTESMVCRMGCDSCCRHLSLFPVEAVHIRLALETAEKTIQERIRVKALAALGDPDGPCPLLDQSLCLLYSARPIICRTHGFPILVDQGQGKAIDHCPLNFIDGQEIQRKHILDLETLNNTLAAINRLFMEDHFNDADSTDRFLLAEALLMEIDGDGDD